MASSVLLHTVSQSRIDLLSPSGGQIQTMCRRFGQKIFKYRTFRGILPGTTILTLMRNDCLFRPGKRTTKDSYDWQTTQEVWEWFFSRGEIT